MRSASGASSDSIAGSVPMSVLHARLSLRPTTTEGTVRTEPSASGSNEKAPNATGPVPGTPTSSATSSESNTSASDSSARRKRPSPGSTLMRAALPQAINPSARCSQASPKASGWAASRSGGDSIAVVVATNRSSVTAWFP